MSIARSGSVLRGLHMQQAFIVFLDKTYLSQLSTVKVPFGVSLTDPLPDMRTPTEGTCAQQEVLTLNLLHPKDVLLD